MRRFAALQKMLICATKRRGWPSSGTARIINADPHAVTNLLRCTRWLLIVSAISLLTYSAFVFAEAGFFQRAENAQLNRHKNAATSDRSGDLVAGSLRVSNAAGNPALIGRIEIPRLALSVIVMEGTSAKDLRRAAGHIAGTSLPGQPGNIGISAHRDTFFRPLRNIAPNDAIMLTTTTGEYRYRVLSTTIVAPEEVAVLAPGVGETVTLVTCYPFYFVGPAPKRFIVRAERVS